MKERKDVCRGCKGKGKKVFDKDEPCAPKNERERERNLGVEMEKGVGMKLGLGANLTQ